jgi:hypothetical protein
MHIDILPEEDGRFTLWLKELNVAATGATLSDARAELLVEVRAYVADYLAHADQYRQNPDLAVQESLVSRLAMVTTEDNLGRIVFELS